MSKVLWKVISIFDFQMMGHILTVSRKKNEAKNLLKLIVSMENARLC